MADDPEEDRGRREDSERKANAAPGDLAELAGADQDAGGAEDRDRGDHERGMDDPGADAGDVQRREQRQALEDDRQHSRPRAIRRGELKRERDQDQSEDRAEPRAEEPRVRRRRVMSEGGPLHGVYLYGADRTKTAAVCNLAADGCRRIQGRGRSRRRGPRPPVLRAPLGRSTSTTRSPRSSGPGSRHPRRLEDVRLHREPRGGRRGRAGSQRDPARRRPVRRGPEDALGPGRGAWVGSDAPADASAPEPDGAEAEPDDGKAPEHPLFTYIESHEPKFLRDLGCTRCYRRFASRPGDGFRRPPDDSAGGGMGAQRRFLMRARGCWSRASSRDRC